MAKNCVTYDNSGKNNTEIKKRVSVNTVDGQKIQRPAQKTYDSGNKNIFNMNFFDTNSREVAK